MNAKEAWDDLTGKTGRIIGVNEPMPSIWFNINTKQYIVCTRQELPAGRWDRVNVHELMEGFSL